MKQGKYHYFVSRRKETEEGGLENSSTRSDNDWNNVLEISRFPVEGRKVKMRA